MDENIQIEWAFDIQIDNSTQYDIIDKNVFRNKYTPVLKEIKSNQYIHNNNYYKLIKQAGSINLSGDDATSLCSDILYTELYNLLTEAFSFTKLRNGKILTEHDINHALQLRGEYIIDKN